MLEGKVTRRLGLGREGAFVSSLWGAPAMRGADISDALSHH